MIEGAIANHQVFFIHGEPFEIRAHIAINSNSVHNAIVFVHGFFGNSRITWDEFPRLFTENSNSSCLDSDLYFLEYASTDRSIGNTAWDLVDFLKKIVPDPSGPLQDLMGSTGLATLRPAKSFEYQQLVLVGHSLGGVVIRKALIDTVRKPIAGLPDRFESLIREATVLLFAPAIGGVLLSGPKGLLSEFPVIGAFKRMYQGYSVSLAEISQGSQFLESIRATTNHFANQPGAARSLTASIAWAENDDLIANYCGYMHDTDEVRIQEASHWSVCKPEYDDDPQFEFLMSRIV